MRPERPLALLLGLGLAWPAHAADGGACRGSAASPGPSAGSLAALAPPAAPAACGAAPVPGAWLPDRLTAAPPHVPRPMPDDGLEFADEGQPFILFLLGSVALASSVATGAAAISRNEKMREATTLEELDHAWLQQRILGGTTLGLLAGGATCIVVDFTL